MKPNAAITVGASTFVMTFMAMAFMTFSMGDKPPGFWWAWFLGAGIGFSVAALVLLAYFVFRGDQQQEAP